MPNGRSHGKRGTKAQLFGCCSQRHYQDGGMVAKVEVRKDVVGYLILIRFRPNHKFELERIRENLSV